MRKVYFRVFEWNKEYQNGIKIKGVMEIPPEKFTYQSKIDFIDNAIAIYECRSFYEEPVLGFLTNFKECFGLEITKEDFKKFWVCILSGGTFDFYECDVYENQKYVSKIGCEQKILQSQNGFGVYTNSLWSEKRIFKEGKFLGETFIDGEFHYKIEEKWFIINGCFTDKKEGEGVFLITKKEFDDNRRVLINN